MKSYLKKKWVEFKKYWHEYAAYWFLTGFQLGAATMAIWFTIIIAMFGLCEK